MKLLHSALVLAAATVVYGSPQRVTVTRTTIGPRPTTTQKPPPPPPPPPTTSKTTARPTTTSKPPPPPPTTSKTSTTSAQQPTPSSGPQGPQGFNITDVGVNGSGCPPGSASWVLAADRSAVTIVLSQMGAEVGPGISPSANRRNCQVTLQVGMPSGFTMALTTVDYRGYYQLDRGVTAAQEAMYYWQGQQVQSNARGNLAGPIDGAEYTFRDAFNVTSLVFSPCGQNTVLNIVSAVSVSNSNNRDGSGYITTDSIDANLKTTYNFQWQTCR